MSSYENENHYEQSIAYTKGQVAESERIIKLLQDLNVVRRCGATGKLVAFNTDGDKVVYLTGLEGETN